MATLEQWIAVQYRRAAEGMLTAISPLDLVKSRPGFGQMIAPKRGAIIASPVLGAYDPDPDYFFHWFRDSAVVIDALRLLFEDRTVGSEALGHFADFVGFSRALRELDGRKLAAASAWRTAVAPAFQQYVRIDADLAAAYGESIVAETRVNADGTLDISRWARPQHDGPPLRALALLRWLGSGALDPGFDGAATVAIDDLLRGDLDFTRTHWREPSFDIWEEEAGEHYYTLAVSAAALDAGADWLQAHGERQQAQMLRAEVAPIRQRLDAFWMPAEGHYSSRVLGSGARSAKELDIAVILAAIHAGGSGRAHTVDDPRQQATLARLEECFDADYPINHSRAADRGPAMGRYRGDVYYSGGAYFFSTLGAAEFCFRAAPGAGTAGHAWIARGDGFLATVRAYTLATGDMSEQFDQRTGEQTSAKHLAWSYAAFISSIAARRDALAALR
jgi:glycosyl hydrolase family 15